MKTLFTYVLASCIAFSLNLCVPQGSAFCETIRDPVWAGKFYPGEAKKLQQTIRKLTEQAQKATPELPGSGYQLKALIMPHAGYIYSGLTAAHASHALNGQTFNRVFILGPDHNVGFRHCAVSHADTWETPLGRVQLHTNAKRLCQKKPFQFRSIPESDKVEHSVEVVVPFLQYYLKDFSLIPLTIGRCDPAELAQSLSESTDLLKPDTKTLLVISSDLSHYLPYGKAVEKDQKTIEKILALDSENFCRKGNCACGMIPTLTLIELAKKNNWRPYLLHYSNSGDTAGSKDRVVGYASIAFYGGNLMKENKTSQQFSDEQGQVLVKLARKTISENLAKKTEPVSIPDNDIFDSKRGTFVTLKINNQLRGCIGNLSSENPVIEGVQRNALSAAFSDYRFPPLSDNELDLIDIEVSILTEPTFLPHSGGEDLLSKLRPGIDGVIIKSGRNQATFLPQVWDQLPKPQQFLEHLCQKANLPANAWTSSELEVSTYQVQYFDEEK